MNVIFKFLFERLTDPLGLPVNAFYEYIILVVLGEVAYELAYGKVGDMYHSGIIEGRAEGSFFHWIIRTILFVVLWLVAYGTIQGYYFVMANWKLILIIIGSVAGTAMLCALAVATMRFAKKHSKVNGNA